MWLSRAEESYLPTIVSSLDAAGFFYVQQFAMELPPRVGEGRPRGGVALICRQRSGFSFRTVDCGDARLCGVAVLTGDRPILSVVGCYMPYWDSSGPNAEDYAAVIGKLDAILSSLRACAPTVLIGDFNCALCPLSRESRPPAWYRLRGFTPNSVAMQDLLDDHDLSTAEFRFTQPVTYTYSRAGKYSHIDHIAVPNLIMSQVLGCNILPPDENNLSPHLPLVCRLVISAPAGTDRPDQFPAESTRCSDILDWSCAEKVESYKTILHEMLSESLSVCGETLDDLDTAISRCIHAAARAAGCSKPRRQPRSWWTPSAAAARNRSRFWHRLWVCCGRPAAAAVTSCYREARRSYRRARRKAALSQMEKEARLLRFLRRDRNLTAFWRRVQLARRGGLPAGSDCCAADFRAHFQAVHHDSREELSDEQRLIADAVEAHILAARAVVGDRTVSPEQVADLLRLLHPGKAPGVDGVTPEHLLFGSIPTLLAALARLLTGCLSSCTVPASFAQSVVVPLLKNSHLDPSRLDNYRPISITTCASKLLELIVLEELQSSFIPHDLQFGFISNRGTAEASLLIGETIQQNRRMGLPVFAANLDARKCFDRIWHDGLFYRLVEHLSANCWLLVVSWYRHLAGRVFFGGSISEEFSVVRGTRQGAILSPAFANVFLHPLLAALDDIGCGAYLQQHHVPGVCYADDLFLLSTNARHLSTLLGLVSDFARNWRLDFVHSDSVRTKSHCIVFGGELLAHSPTWMLSGQQLMTRVQTQHLGVMMDSRLTAACHVDQRVKRARAAFYGLAPAGMLAKSLCPADKAYLWKTVVLPVLVFGCNTAPLRPSDVERLDALQAACVKAAFGLPRSAHHSALLAAAGVAPIQEWLRNAIFCTFRAAMSDGHRLQQVLLTSLAKLALHPSSLEGSFLLQVHQMCNCDFQAVMELAAGGAVDPDRVRAHHMSNGLADSIRLVLNGSCPASRRLLRLLTCWQPTTSPAPASNMTLASN